MVGNKLFFGKKICDDYGLKPVFLFFSSFEKSKLIYGQPKYLVQKKKILPTLENFFLKTFKSKIQILFIIKTFICFIYFIYFILFILFYFNY